MLITWTKEDEQVIDEDEGLASTTFKALTASGVLVRHVYSREGLPIQESMVFIPDGHISIN